MEENPNNLQAYPTPLGSPMLLLRRHSVQMLPIESSFYWHTEYGVVCPFFNCVL